MRALGCEATKYHIWRARRKLSRSFSQRFAAGFGFRLALLDLRPIPVLDFWLVYALGIGVRDALDDLLFEPFLQMRARTLEAGNAVDHINGQCETIDLIANREFQ